MARQAILRTRVRFGETDAAGIVFYPTYFGWFDSGTHGLLREGDAPTRDEHGAPKFPLPIVECGATFLAPLQFDEEIEIVSTVASLGESSLRVEHEVRTLTGKTCARGFEQRVFVTIAGGRPHKAPIPPELRAHLEG
ncbi:MAG TPA: acyl-CoA thioesterase [Candidatus Lustribacter sp.]|nr:acyl-CoA thioesterase [Candidatus Lustribacter sp.]